MRFTYRYEETSELLCLRFQLVCIRRRRSRGLFPYFQHILQKTQINTKKKQIIAKNTKRKNMPLKRIMLQIRNYSNAAVNDAEYIFDVSLFSVLL